MTHSPLPTPHWPLATGHFPLPNLHAPPFILPITPPGLLALPPAATRVGDAVDDTSNAANTDPGWTQDASEGLHGPPAPPPSDFQPTDAGRPLAGPVHEAPASAIVATPAPGTDPLPAPNSPLGTFFDAPTIGAAAFMLAALVAVGVLRGRRSAIRPAAAPAMSDRVERLEAQLAEAHERIGALEGLLTEPVTAPSAIPSSVRLPRGLASHPDTESARPTPARSAPVPAPISDDPAANRIYELADAGKSPVEIAATLAEHTGKVELLLNLRRAARRA